MIGETIGKYRVDDFIGAGGMGEIWLATDTGLNRLVALKVLPPQLVSQPDRRARLVREARLVAALAHPHIATIYEILEEQDRLMLVMEYVKGENLRDLARHGPVSVKRVLEIGEQMAGALGAAHQRGIVHRDIKPDNIIVNDEGVAKLLDFGLARFREEVAQMEEVSMIPTVPGIRSEPGTPLGTLNYMSPEQAAGRPVGAESDIFSLGVTLYEMATGQRAFQADSRAALVAAILRDTPPPARALRMDLPPEIEPILTRATAKDVSDRYHDARDLAADLRAVRLRLESSASFSSGFPLPGPEARRSPLWPAATVAAAAALALAAWWWLGPADRPAPPTPGTGQMRLLLSSQEALWTPALSPDAKMIAWVAEENGVRDLFVRRVAGGPALRLTEDRAREEDPEFSPDGERIAFTRFDTATGDPEIIVIPSLGGERLSRIASGSDPAWSPDGTRLAFIHRPAGEDLYTVCTARTAGGDLRDVLESDGFYPFFHAVSWSPDGRNLAVIRSSGGTAGELWLVPLDGGDPVRLGDDPPGVVCQSPSFMPGGDGILHMSSRAGASNLWVMPLDGGEPRRITTGSGPDQVPSIARDGSIVFVNSRSRGAMLIHDFAGGRTETLLDIPQSIWAPAFSPDGAEIAFSQTGSREGWGIWKIQTGGGEPRLLTLEQAGAIYPRYTPDGKAIVYFTWSALSSRLWRIPAEGGPAVSLTPEGGPSEAYPDVSPDGRLVAFTRIEDEEPHIHIAPLDGGESRRLTDTPSTLARWSPDGSRIAFATDRSYRRGIRIIHADGGGERRLTEEGGWPAWWPDGSRIGFQVVGADGYERLFTVSPEGGEPEPLDIFQYKTINCPFDVSPDGGRIVTSNLVPVSAEIWLLTPHAGR
jgi:Tol biopolymer transport system component/predicted Ser/Thr protein kinase